MVDLQNRGSLTRRNVMGRLLAGGILANAGCEKLTAEGEPFEQVGKPGPTKPEPEFKSSFRIFEFEVKQSAEAMLADRIRKSGGTPSEVNYLGPNQNHVILAWIKPQAVADLKKLEGVVEGRKITPKSIVEPQQRVGWIRNSLVQPPADGFRSFYVVLGPNSWSTAKPPGIFEPTEKIATRWASQLGHLPDVSIKSVESESWSKIRTEGFYIGPIEGQIEISLPAGDVPPELLKTILKHPQVQRLQWDRPEDVYHCPPCGSG
ncbi:MAG: hypothetical protein ACI8P0_000575 [Planctomycetaceae bacterium]|jgi:hypothetical protein